MRRKRLSPEEWEKMMQSLQEHPGLQRPIAQAVLAAARATAPSGYEVEAVTEARTDPSPGGR